MISAPVYKSYCNAFFYIKNPLILAKNPVKEKRLLAKLYRINR